MGVTILRTGRGTPKTSVSNQDLTKHVDTSDKWIRERTGVESRFIAIEESGLDLAISSIKNAFNKEGEDPIDPASIDLIIVATVTPDQLVPSMGSMIKRELGMNNAVAFDVNAACSGFVYALWMAESLLKTDNRKRALVVGVERISRITNWEDRGTCILFGDGAGAALLESDSGNPGILSTYIKNYDDVNNALICGAEYRETPFYKDAHQKQYIEMHGTQVFKFAVSAMGEVMVKALEKANLSPDDIKFYVPHQANMRIISAAANRFKQPIEKFQVTIQYTGNASAASIPMALNALMESGQVKKKDKIMIVGFGGGLSAAALIFEVA